MIFTHQWFFKFSPTHSTWAKRNLWRKKHPDRFFQQWLALEWFVCFIMIKVISKSIFPLAQTMEITNTAFHCQRHWIQLFKNISLLFFGITYNQFFCIPFQPNNSSATLAKYVGLNKSDSDFLLALDRLRCLEEGFIFFSKNVNNPVKIKNFLLIWLWFLHYELSHSFNSPSMVIFSEHPDIHHYQILDSLGKRCLPHNVISLKEVCSLENPIAHDNLKILPVLYNLTFTCNLRGTKQLENHQNSFGTFNTCSGIVVKSLWSA